MNMGESYYWLPLGLMMAGMFTYSYVKLLNTTKKKEEVIDVEKEECKSAYEIAKKLGFSGTKEEWLESLTSGQRDKLMMSDCHWLDNYPKYVSIQSSSDASCNTLTPKLDPLYPNPNETFEEWETRSIIRGLEIERARVTKKAIREHQKRRMGFRKARKLKGY